MNCSLVHVHCTMDYFMLLQFSLTCRVELMTYVQTMHVTCTCTSHVQTMFVTSRVPKFLKLGRSKGKREPGNDWICMCMNIQNSHVGIPIPVPRNLSTRWHLGDLIFMINWALMIFIFL